MIQTKKDMKHTKENMKTKQDALDAMSNLKADLANPILTEMEDFIYSEIISNEDIASAENPLEIKIDIGIAGLSLWKRIKVRI